MLAALKDDPDCYGVLRPRDPHLSYKSVSKEAALLLLTLQEASELPRFAKEALGTQRDAVIAEMVLDGVLEIEWNGKMVSGPAAIDLIKPKCGLSDPKTKLALLSRKAVEYALTLDIVDAGVLSERLYCFNRIPVSARWQRLFGDEHAVEQHLGLQTQLAATLHTSWVRLPASGDGWIAWRSRRNTPVQRGLPTYKLYVSPAPSDLATTFHVVARVLARSPSLQWKIGANVYGLLRPDKLVAYFASFADLQETAAALFNELIGSAEHGVPFTAPLGPQSLLSWGIDPSPDDSAVTWPQRESWRTRICNRLAIALIAAKAARVEAASVLRFAFQRLALDGIDVERWAPLQ